VFTNVDVRLRVWFNGGLGLQALAPDRRLSAVGYALMAGNVPDGLNHQQQTQYWRVYYGGDCNGRSRYSQLANTPLLPQHRLGVITGDKIASNTITAANLASGAARFPRAPRALPNSYQQLLPPPGSPRS